MKTEIEQLIAEITAAFKDEEGKVISLPEVLRQNAELGAMYKDLGRFFS